MRLENDLKISAMSKLIILTVWKCILVHPNENRTNKLLGKCNKADHSVTNFFSLVILSSLLTRFSHCSTYNTTFVSHKQLVAILVNGEHSEFAQSGGPPVRLTT